MYYFDDFLQSKHVHKRLFKQQREIRGGTIVKEEKRAILANTIHRPNAGWMLSRRLRRRPNIHPALGQRIVFAGL